MTVSRGCRVWLAVVVGLILMIGCVGPDVVATPTMGLIERVGQWKQADRYRLGALEELVSRPLSPEERDALGAALADVLADSRQSAIVRARVAEIVEHRYPVDASRWLSRGVTATGPGELRTKLLAMLGEGADVAVVENLVIAWADTREDSAGNAELARAVGRVGGGDVDEVLVKVLREGTSEEGRLAAVACLGRRGEGRRACEAAAALAGEDPFEETLRFWAGGFGTVPSNEARLFACRWQQTQLSEAVLDRVRQRVALLAGREGYRYRTCDAYLLATVSEEAVGRSRREWGEAVSARLGVLEHRKRPASYAGADDDYREDFSGQRNLLDYTDLVRVGLLLKTLEGGAGSLAQRIRDERAKGPSEAGGLCFAEGSRVVFRVYEPAERRGANLYVESPEMVRDGAYCLARWHSHASQDQQRGAPVPPSDETGEGRWRWAQWAGPGIDDMEYVGFFGTPLVVVTQVEGMRYNVDYVNPEGVVIDLGVYAGQ